MEWVERYGSSRGASASDRRAGRSAGAGAAAAAFLVRAFKMPPASGATVLTVSQISAQIKELLEGEFPAVWIVGEVSSLTLARSGHLYFNLKDAGAVVRAVM